MSQTAFTTQPLISQETDGGPVVKKRWLVTAVLIVFALFVCRDVWLDIFRIVHKDEEASHIFLVPLVFARIAWVRRQEFKNWKPSASLWGIAITLLGVALWLVGNIKAMQVVWHFGAILAAFGVFVSVNGMQIVRRLWPVFLVLVFLMPLPGVVRHPLALFLQNASAKATEVVIVALGFDLTRYGNLLLINDYTVGVAEACNGMRMVSMLLLIVFAFVFSESIRPWVRILLIFMAVPIAILCNIARLVPTVLAYGYFSPELADQIHDWLGWVLAIGSYFVLMGVLWLMRWLLLPVDPLPSRPRRQIPKRHERAKILPIHIRPYAAVAGVVIVLSSALGVGWSLPDGSGAAAYHQRVKVAAVDLPRDVGDWSGADTELPESAVALLRPNVLISRRYENKKTGQSFAMLIVQCADARDMEGHYPPNCYPSSGWTDLSKRRISVQAGSLNAASMEYEFERSTRDFVERIGVVNLILVPGDGFVTSMGSIRKLAGTISDRYYGAAQVQFVFSSQWSRKQRLAVVEEFGAVFEPLLGIILDKTVEAEDRVDGP